MSEQILQVLVTTKLLWVVGFAYLYGRGGINGKWWRRIIGSLFLTAGVVLYSLIQSNFSWWALLFAPLLYGSLSIGYGGDELKEKIIKRSRYGLACGVAAIPLAIVSGNWALFGLHIFLCVLVSTSLGVWNITNSARSEETLIGATIALLPMYLI